MVERGLWSFQMRFKYNLSNFRETYTRMEPWTNLGEEYCRFALPIIQEQLAQAGIRVAFTLNEIFR